MSTVPSVSLDMKRKRNVSQEQRIERQGGVYPDHNPTTCEVVNCEVCESIRWESGAVDETLREILRNIREKQEDINRRSDLSMSRISSTLKEVREAMGVIQTEVHELKLKVAVDEEKLDSARDYIDSELEKIREEIRTGTQRWKAIATITGGVATSLLGLMAFLWALLK